MTFISCPKTIISHLELISIETNILARLKVSVCSKMTFGDKIPIKL